MKQRRNKLEDMMFPLADENLPEVMAIIMAINWIADHDYQEKFGVTWYETCKELVKPY